MCWKQYGLPCCEPRKTAHTQMRMCVFNRLNYLSLSGCKKLGEGQTVDCDSLLALTSSLLWARRRFTKKKKKKEAKEKEKESFKDIFCSRGVLLRIRCQYCWHRGSVCSQLLPIRCRHVRHTLCESLVQQRPSLMIRLSLDFQRNLNNQGSREYIF